MARHTRTICRITLLSFFALPAAVAGCGGDSSDAASAGACDVTHDFCASQTTLIFCEYPSGPVYCGPSTNPSTGQVEIVVRQIAPSDPRCPAIAPNAGTSCSVASDLTCSYQACSAEFSCQGGLWAVKNVSC